MGKAWLCSGFLSFCAVGQEVAEAAAGVLVTFPLRIFFLSTLLGWCFFVQCHSSFVSHERGVIIYSPNPLIRTSGSPDLSLTQQTSTEACPLCSGLSPGSSLSSHCSDINFCLLCLITLKVYSKLLPLSYDKINH